MKKLTVKVTTVEEIIDLDVYIHDLVSNYKGDITHLGDALGALNVGKFYGWKVLRIIYSPLAYRKYENILGFKFKDVLPEIAEFTHKSKGYKLVTTVHEFWKVVNRKVVIPSSERVATIE